MMLSLEEANRFAQEWISAWNGHDLERILDHYADQIVFCSPFVVKLTGNPAGRLTGKDQLRGYFGRALAEYPDLHFTLHTVLCGVESLTLYYTSVNGLLAAETMLLDEGGRVTRVCAHYDRV